MLMRKNSQVKNNKLITEALSIHIQVMQKA